MTPDSTRSASMACAGFIRVHSERLIHGAKLWYCNGSPLPVALAKLQCLAGCLLARLAEPSIEGVG
jgi:hypothetical protein